MLETLGLVEKWYWDDECQYLWYAGSSRIHVSAYPSSSELQHVFSARIMAGWYRKGGVPKRAEGREQRKERREKREEIKWPPARFTAFLRCPVTTSMRAAKVRKSTFALFRQKSTKQRVLRRGSPSRFTAYLRCPVATSMRAEMH